MQASSAGANGDLDGARSNRNKSLGLSAATLLVGIAGLAIVFGIVFGYYWPVYQATDAFIRNNGGSQFPTFGK